MAFINRQGPDPVNVNLWRLSGLLKSTSGFTLAGSELPLGTNHILKGTPVAVDYSDNTANIVKTARVTTGGTTTAPRVEKNHLFKQGDVVFISVGAAAMTINSINTTNADYDTLTLSGALTGATATATLLEATVAGGSAGTFKYSPNALILEDVVNEGQPSVTGLISAVEIIEDSLPFYLNDVVKAALRSQLQFQFI